MTSASAGPDNSSIDRFFERLEARIDDPVHKRLVQAAHKADPKTAMENELTRVIEELLR